VIEGVQDGDRTLREQLTGMSTIERLVKGATVLDFGCAEGLISMHLARAGAAKVLGFSMVPSEIDTGRRLIGELPVELRAVDLNRWAEWAAEHPLRRHDVVLLLSILHKLKRPDQFLRQALELAGSIVAVRLPGPVIDDARSDHRRVNVEAHLVKQFDLVEKPKGPRGEWQTIWRRRAE
jgi:predicted RNA methylase